MSRRARPVSIRGFTLIELLTVIAIIAILTAILLPVFATVRENARQSTSIANMHQISVALGQYQLDKKTYPEVLFGYVYHQNGDPTSAVVPMDKALAQAESDYNADLAANVTDVATLEKHNPATYFTGLYPEYIKEISSFRDANNPITELDKSTGRLAVNILCHDDNDSCANQMTGTLVVAAATKTLQNGQTSEQAPDPRGEFYVADAYDSSPQISDGTNNQLVKNNGNFVYVPRYQSAWTAINSTLNCDNNAASGLCSMNSGRVNRNDYVRQGHWRVPPADTYLTCTTYHVPNANKVLVLWEDGAARKLSPQDFLATGSDAGYQADVADISVSGNGVSQANFWKTPLNR